MKRLSKILAALGTIGGAILLMGTVAALGADYPEAVHSFPIRYDKSTSGYAVAAERVVVPSASPYTAYLQQVPKSGTTPVATYEIGGGSLTRTDDNPPLQAGYYYVSYSTGDLVFHAGDAGEALLFTYTGIGSLIRAGHLNEIQDEAAAVEAELGVDPAGDWSTVAERLDNITSGTVSVGNADTVDGIHASTTPTTGTLYPLGPGAVFPAGVLPETTAWTDVDNNFSLGQTAPSWTGGHVGDGSGLTGLDAGELDSGTVPDGRFPATLPAASGANLTDLDADALTTGTVPDGRFPGILPAASGANLTDLNADELSTGTVPDGRFPATLPVASGANLTDLDADTLATGTVADARLAANIARTDQATSWSAAIEAPSAHITGNLTVDGLIDPTGIVMVPQASNPGGGEAANTLWAREAAPSGLVVFGVGDRPAGAMERTIRVAADGTADYTTIADGIAAATALLPTTGVIEVYPGTYAEQNLEISAGWSLVGRNRDTCIISMTSTNYDEFSALTSALVALPYSGSVENLTIWNTRNLYPSVALAIGWGWTAGTTSAQTIRVRNCLLKGGKEDVAYLRGDNDILVSDSWIESTSGGDTFAFDPASAGTTHRARNCTIVAGGNNNPPVWFSGAGTALLEGCRIVTVNATYGAARFGNTYGQGGTLYTVGCRLENADGSLAIPLHAVSSGTGFGFDLQRCVFSDTARTDSDVTISYDHFSQDVAFSGTLNSNGALYANNAMFSRASGNTLLEIPSDLGFGGIVFYDSAHAEDGTLCWQSTDTLKLRGTRDDLGETNLIVSGYTDVASLKIAGTERISGAGAVSAVGLSNTEAARWRDFAAVACASPVTQYSFDSDYGPYGWRTNTGLLPTHIECVAGSGIGCYFPLPYEPGTIITQLRVKWRAVGTGDGVKLRLVRRDESGAATAWTTVGTQQTYTDAGAPFDVTVSTYDLPDETLAANTSYAIEVESVVAVAGVSLYAVGIETSKRVY